jgi:hypothetical protein
MLVMAALFGSLLAATSAQAEITVRLFSDEAGTSCELAAVPGLVRVYMFKTGSDGATGVRFSAPMPACWAGATYAVDQIAPGLTAVGNSQSDLIILLGGCMSGTVLLGDIAYIQGPNDTACCAYPVLPASNQVSILATDCVFAEVVAGGLPSLVVNPTPACPTDACRPLATNPTTWGQVKALYRN